MTNLYFLMMSSSNFIIIRALALAFALATQFATPVSAATKEIFTTNAVCRQNFCVNPIFPGLEDLYTLSQMEFSCQELTDVSVNLHFCADVVNYNPSLPKPTGPDAEAKSVPELVREMEQRAMTTYVLHLQ